MFILLCGVFFFLFSIKYFCESYLLFKETTWYMSYTGVYFPWLLKVICCWCVFYLSVFNVLETGKALRGKELFLFTWTWWSNLNEAVAKFRERRVHELKIFKALNRKKEWDQKPLSFNGVIQRLFLLLDRVPEKQK